LTNGDTIKIVYFREIFIAAIGLLFVPNNIKIDIEDLIGKSKLLSDLGENRLAQNEEMINKLNKFKKPALFFFCRRIKQPTFYKKIPFFFTKKFYLAI